MRYTDPPVHERVWFRHRMTGQKAFLVQRDGRDMIKFDRVNEEIIQPFTPGEWAPDHETRPMTEAAVTLVAYMADKQLCITLGMHEKAKKDWHSLTDEERIGWMREGPADPSIRAELYAAIMEVLRPLT